MLTFLICVKKTPQILLQEHQEHVVQLSNLFMVLEGHGNLPNWCFVLLKKAFKLVAQNILLRVLHEYGIMGVLPWAIQFLYKQEFGPHCQQQVGV